MSIRCQGPSQNASGDLLNKAVTIPLHEPDSRSFEAGYSFDVMAAMLPSAIAFDAVAPAFDLRFGAWKSVAAQRRAVRATLLREFPAGGNILELGGGTGEDAVFLARHGFSPFLTDPSPAMVSLAKQKLALFGGHAEVAAGEEMEAFASKHLSCGRPLFDAAFSNFAPLNCVSDLSPVARGLARILKCNAPAILVMFGTLCFGEIVTEALRGRVHQVLRRCKRGQAPARIAGHDFHVVYHRRRALVQAFAPWFVLEKQFGVGVTVPPSAAEPWISQHPRLLTTMESLDKILARPLAFFGDHVLYQFRRTDAP